MNIVKSVYSVISDCIKSNEFKIFKNINHQKNYLFTYSQVWDGNNLITLNCLNDIPLDNFYYVTVEDDTVVDMIVEDSYLPPPLNYITTCMVADTEPVIDNILDNSAFFEKIDIGDTIINNDSIQIFIDNKKWNSISIKNKLNDKLDYTNSWIYISTTTHLSPYSINNTGLHKSAIITSTYKQMQIYTLLEFCKI